MSPFITRTTVKDDGSIQVGGLPFPPGAEVEILVKSLPAKPATAEPETDRYPLRGLANQGNYHYYLPFEPADLEDWEKTLETVSPYEREGRLELLEPEDEENPAGESRE